MTADEYLQTLLQKYAVNVSGAKAARFRGKGSGKHDLSSTGKMG